MTLSHSNTVLQLPLPEPVHPGGTLRLELEFNGQVPQDFGRGTGKTGYGIFNFSQGVMSMAGWYPTLAVYDAEGWNLDPVSQIGDSVCSDMAFYDVNVVADRNLVVAATGVRVGREEQGGKVHSRFVSGPARDFYLALSPDFKVASREVGGTLLNAYTLPEHESAGLETLTNADHALHTYNRLFGSYQYAEFDVVDAPLRYALAVEFPGIVLIGSELYERPHAVDFEGAIAHEMAHQWWYNLVGNDVIDDPWLDEAFTTYSSSLYFQEAHGEDAYQAMVASLEERYNSLIEDGQDSPVDGSLRFFEAPGSSGRYGGVVYAKGALFFKAVRDEIGDAAFFQALQRYYSSYRYRIAQPADLLASFETAAGRELDDLYETWLFNP